MSWRDGNSICAPMINWNIAEWIVIVWGSDAERAASGCLRVLPRKQWRHPLCLRTGIKVTSPLLSNGKDLSDFTKLGHSRIWEDVCGYEYPTRFYCQQVSPTRALGPWKLSAQCFHVGLKNTLCLPSAASGNYLLVLERCRSAEACRQPKSDLYIRMSIVWSRQ